MTHRTLVLSSLGEYLEDENESPEDSSEEVQSRQVRLERFPHTVMLKLAFPELDFSERWCWQNFGPMDGECRQKYSEYRVCADDSCHTHRGKWTSHWYVKTDYDFGFCEFHFENENERDQFLQQLPEFSWGENYPK